MIALPGHLHMIQATMPELSHSTIHLRDSALLERTPVSDGDMVWRIWGSGPPVVLLHGAFGGWMHWARNIAELAERRTVIVPDLPGAGDSAVGDAQAMDDLGATVIDGLDRLGVREPFDLVAFSFGTSVALHIPPVHRQRVKRLVLMGSAAIGPFVPVRTLQKWRKIADPGERAAIHAANLQAMMLWNKVKIDDEAVAIHMHNVEAWRLKLRTVSPTGRSAARLADWRPDQLDMVWGAEDVIVKTTFEPLMEILRGAAPAVRTHFIAGAGHWVQYEGSAAANCFLSQL